MNKPIGQLTQTRRCHARAEEANGAEMNAAPFTFTREVHIRQDRDGDDQLPPALSQALRKCAGNACAHFFGESSARNVTFYFECEKDKNKVLNDHFREKTITTRKKEIDT